jgi:hypothetical protein
MEIALKSFLSIADDSPGSGDRTCKLNSISLIPAHKLILGFGKISPTKSTADQRDLLTLWLDILNIRVRVGIHHYIGHFEACRFVCIARRYAYEMNRPCAYSSIVDPKAVKFQKQLGLQDSLIEHFWLPPINAEQRCGARLKICPPTAPVTPHDDSCNVYYVKRGAMLKMFMSLVRP